MSNQLQRALEQVAHRFRHFRLWMGLAVCWLVGALIGTGLYAVGLHSAERLIRNEWLLAAFGFVAVTAACWAIFALRSARDSRWVARRIEATHPELKTGLLAAIEEAAAPREGRLGFLQAAVIRKALEHRRANNWDETVPSWKLRGAHVAHACAIVFLIAVAIALNTQASSQTDSRLTTVSGTSAADVRVEPGNAEIERGTSLLVVARFPGGVPVEASLVVDDKAKTAAHHKMTRSLEDPTFAARVESVDADLAYRVEFEGKSTETFHVKVFEYPELERTDAKLVFPSYTSLEPKTVEDIRHVTAVEGTEVTLLCRLNKDVATAGLIDAEEKTIELTPHDQGTHVYRATLTLAEPRRFRVALVDRDGRSNKLASEIVANVTRNRPAVVKMTQPAHDVSVSPLEELKLKAELEDDFGVVRHGLSVSMAGREPREIVMQRAAGGNRQLRVDHLLDFEALKAETDQLLTYFFWAEDIGPDGQPRRTSGDMYFAEVRPFEEIFRQGEQPPSGSADEQEQNGENARASDQLAELQKEVINATWKVVRRETIGKPTDKLAEDGKVLKESQHAVVERATQVEDRLTDAQSKANLEQAKRFMHDAETHLTAVAQQSAVKSLHPALAAEQAAYQALLKLRAREFQVIRGSRNQRQNGRNSGGNRSQRQLQQLELTDDENRYEDQRTARAQQERLSQREQEQRETRQVLSRLRELAQRQNDVNERLKELQSALEAAKTQEARQEIERQLKRLRDQQQQILRDTDELRERMETEENRDRMADARQQLEQGREHVRQASQALEQGRVPQALTEGARAGRQFNDLREHLRKGASNRFTEEMTEMRNQARALDENQKKLSEQIEAANERPQNSLRDSGERKQTRQGLEEQEKRLDQIQERMQRTVQDAEETEPLLAKGLYDTARKASERKIPDALKAAEQLVDLGVNKDAAKASRDASQGLEEMREGVERAARSVLGDETAALRRAQGEIEDLADQIDREVAQATGRDPASRRGRNAQNDRDAQRSGRQNTAPEGQQDADPFDGMELQGGQPADRPQQKQRDRNAAGESGRQGQQRPQSDQQPNALRNRRSPQGEQRQTGEANQQGEQGQQREQGQQGEQGQQREQGQEKTGGQPDQQGQEGGQGAQGQPGARPQRGRQSGSLRRGGSTPRAGADRLADGQPNGIGGPGNPITGEGFRQWSDRMRDVEELLDNPELRAEAARIRDRVRGAREEFKRHAKVPDWNRLQSLVAEPINELRDRIAEEVRRRESPDSLVPIDRDPVPPQFTEGVRRYYERLGSGQ
jgi:hypothetical protein